MGSTFVDASLLSKTPRKRGGYGRKIRLGNPGKVVVVRLKYQGTGLGTYRSKIRLGALGKVKDEKEILAKIPRKEPRKI